MKRVLIGSFFAVLLVFAYAFRSGGPRAAAQDGASGQGKMRFRVLRTSADLPPEAQNVLKGAHGGFAVDTRPGKGEIYFALKGAGIVQIANDLKTFKMVNTTPDMKATNAHNTTLVSAAGGNTYLAFPGNEVGRVFITRLDGQLLHTLETPEPGVDLGHPAANEYFRGKGKFAPTDVEHIDGMLYITTGYSPLDFVLSARLSPTAPLRATWHDLAFGGKGKGPGQFGTGHGITVPPGTRRLDVADRPNSEIDRFTRYGQYLSTVNLPSGSFPCDIQYLGKHAVVGALHGPDRTKGAPIYILEDDQVVSTIMPKEELGLKNFQHIHNAVLREVGGKLYVIAQAWNPGDFAILEQVSN
jgi:hypothetical protein